MDLENPPDIPIHGHVLHYLEEPEKFTGPKVEWWQEIKNGERTFSFKGDPQIFGIRGPVKSSLVPPLRGKREPLPRIGGNQIAAAQEQHKNRFFIPYLGATLVLLGVFVVLIKS